MCFIFIIPFVLQKPYELLLSHFENKETKAQGDQDS